MNDFDSSTSENPEPEAAETPISIPWEACPIEVEIDYDNRVNFAMQQNDVPVIKRLRLHNRGTTVIDDIEVTIGIAGDFSETKLLRIDHLAPTDEFLLEKFALDLDPRALATRTEREKTRLEVTIVSGQLHHSIHYPIEVLAYNEWAGLSSLPEILSAFVQPNHPAIDGILAKAQKVHAARQGSSSLTGYQSKDPHEVLAEIQSIYEALVALQISYVGVPASFENDGQKVRLTESILENRLGNCLDLSLLFSSCLEQAGLNPIVVLTKGHAFVGAWTREMAAADPSIDDAAILRKRVDLGDLIVLEATAVTTNPPMTFAAASADARRKLDQKDFVVALDVACARRLKIRPLPGRIEQLRPSEFAEVTQMIDVEALQDLEVTVNIQQDDIDRLDDEFDQESLSAEPESDDAAVERRPETRLDRWKRHLLDLSLRNRLLNFRSTKKTLSLGVPDAALLEDRLAEGHDFAILSRTTLDSEDSPRNLAAMNDRTQEDALASFLAAELQAGRLHTALETTELEKRLTEIYRAARTDLEETGSNTLHLALGFLVWYETESSKEERRAPLLMLPIELKRRSARSEYRIKLADDEARINVTLLEKLKRDHGIDITGLDELPTDDAGLDIKAIFRKIRQAIVDMPRWDLAEEAALGLFSFNKFLMWQDLEVHAESLKESAVVRHLIDTAGSSFEPEAVYPKASALDQDLKVSETYCPLDADSSQLAAVVAAAEGRSFVLQGPPGTGKSQTITNLIAQALAKGMRVLFVAEKMAALNVVHSRLSRIGLDTACLEIHSNKSSKRHVLEQLRQAIEEPAVESAPSWERSSAELERHKSELNAYVEAIHEEHEPGISIFEATSRLIGSQEMQHVDVGIENILDLDAETYAQLKDHAQQLGVAAKDLTSIPNHGLFGVQQGEWTPRLAHEIEDSLQQLDVARVEWNESLYDVAEIIGLMDAGRDSLTQEGGKILSELLKLTLNGPGTERSLLTEPGMKEIETRLRASIDRGIARDKMRAELFKRYDDALLDGAAAGFARTLKEAKAALPLVSQVRVFFARRALKPHCKSELPDTDTLLADLDRVQKLQDESQALAATGTDETHFFGRHWRAGRADWAKLSKILDWAARFRIRLQAAQDLGSPELRDRFLALATTDRELILEGATRRKTVERFLEGQTRLEQALAQFVDLTQFELSSSIDLQKDAFSPALEALASRIRGSLRDLRLWCHWARQRGESLRLGLKGVVRALESGRIAADQAGAVFERSFLEDWLDARMAQTPLLLRFNSREHERMIESFRRLDKEHMSLSKQMLKASLQTSAPDLDAQVSARSEVGILQRQLKLKRRHMPIRKLFESLPQLLPRLKPCLLMSPLSVAQYLGPDFPRADLVVFDEASQIPVWDAIGALARGRAAIVVGDSRQLPPTSFFEKSSGEDDEGDDEMVEELESILDECEAAGLKSLRLLWHYRSRHEGLIAFSNHHYYDGRLQTFPAPLGAKEAPGPQLRFIADGIYDRSGTATNQQEAEAITQDLFRRLNDPTESKSIGIVAFSKAQQDLILDQIDKLRREQPGIENHFAEDHEEAVFVKNLENVQGDERDVILFSICYGPDAEGRVSMNFGPLNREGGERRLNVAITRARKELVVFSSVRPEQIDLARTQAIGVSHLKSFLEYTERGPRALGEQARLSADRGRGRFFEEALSRALEERGFEVDREIGCSGFRIDIGVRDPGQPERHLLGIECDGLCYRDAESARDRDRIREGVLKSLGWRLMRVWSQDWYQDPGRELERVLKEIERLIALDAEEKPAEAVLAADLEEAETVIPVSCDDDVFIPDETEDASPEIEEQPERLQSASAAVSNRLYYRELDLKSRELDLDKPGDQKKIDAMMIEVVAHEWPVHKDSVLRRVARASGVDRITARVRAQFEGRILNLVDSGAVHGDGDFLLNADKTAQDISDWRHRREEDPVRDVEEIHLLEIAAAAREVIHAQISLPLEDFYRETARALGFSRSSTKVSQRMQEAVARLAEEGGCVLDEDGARLPREA